MAEIIAMHDQRMVEIFGELRTPLRLEGETAELSEKATCPLNLAKNLTGLKI
jgi:hypothetical protein